MANDALDEIQATVTKIESSKNPGFPWVAVAQTVAGPVRIFLKERPIHEIKPGDELIFLAAEISQPTSDGIPSITPHRNARSSVFSALMSSEVEVYRSANRARETGHVFGMTDAVAWAKRMSMASSAFVTPGVTVLRRPDAESEGDPIIKWVVSKFNDPTIAHLRNAADIIVQPECVNAPERRMRRHSYPPVPNEVIAEALLPAYIAKNSTLTQHAVELGIGLAARAIRPFGNALDHSVGLVFPYSMRATALDQIFSLSLWPGHCGIPRRLTCARSRFLLTAAHEMAHQLRLDIHTDLHQSQPQTKDEAIQKDEAFADSLAILLFVTETGGAEDARRLANMRSAAILTGLGHSHCTGAACHAAVDLGIALHEQHKGRSIQMRQLVEEAVKIALAHPLAAIEDYKFTLNAAEVIDPAWMQRDIQGIADIVGKAAEITRSKIEHGDRLKRDLVLGLRGLHELFHVNPQITIDDYRHKMALLAQMDIQDHVGECQQIARGSALPALEEIIQQTKLICDQIATEFGIGSVGGGSWLYPADNTPRREWSRHELSCMERYQTIPRSLNMAAMLEHNKLTMKLNATTQNQSRPMYVATRRAPEKDWADVSPN